MTISSKYRLLLTLCVFASCMAVAFWLGVQYAKRSASELDAFLTIEHDGASAMQKEQPLESIARPELTDSEPRIGRVGELLRGDVLDNRWSFSRWWQLENADDRDGQSQMIDRGSLLAIGGARNNIRIRVLDAERIETGWICEVRLLTALGDNAGRSGWVFIGDSGNGVRWDD